MSTFNYTFRINAAQHWMQRYSNHSWEYGVASEALLEVYNPGYTVWAGEPFPNDKLRKLPLKKPEGIMWVQRHIRYNGKTLYDDKWGVSDPASLGVAAVMLGRRSGNWQDAARRQKVYLLEEAPRFNNDAISHRTEVAELWSDAISMFPPFLAYFAVSTNDMDLMREAVRQCSLYRDVLMIKEGSTRGLWKHIVGPSEKADDGAWSTGVAWAAFGMARVRATITGWKPSNKSLVKETEQLDKWIREILDAAILIDNDNTGLLRNYLGDDSWFGETSGTALLAATAYRMAVLRPDIFGQDKYVSWAHEKRQAVFDRVDDDGFAMPQVNSLKHDSREPLKTGSAEGQAFLLLLGAAWRDYVCTLAFNAH